ncbi:MAG: heme-copper oxidase subunit III [Acidobacteria bacterium]|nr:heme-copper oxidase subunit III [Acidobacteriota bacterium]
MAGKTAVEELELIDAGRPPRDSGGAGDFGGRRPTPAVPQVYVTGIWLALASILMFFMALTSALIVRRGLSTDWVPFDLPPLLWWNTAALLASSLTLETAHRALAAGRPLAYHRWWNVTTALGVLFLAGQWMAWAQLRAAGVYLATNPSSSFFYVLTGVHGLHLLGGIVALLYVATRRRRAAPWPVERTAVTATSIYWHFLSGLWVFLLLLLWWGR